MEAEHIVGASTTIGIPLDGNHDDRHSGGRRTGLAATGDDGTVTDQKAAVIGRSKCTVAQKLERRTTPDGGISVQEWGASAAPPTDIPLSAGDELPPPLLDGGQGKINSTARSDSVRRETDDGFQVTVTGDGDRVDNVGTRKEAMTAIRDRIRSSNASCTLNRVDLPRSETTPTQSSVVPPSGETTVNECTPPSNGRPLGQGRGCGGEFPCTAAPTTRPQHMGERPLWTAFNRPSY
jgi:hypothetical protein